VVPGGPADRLKSQVHNAVSRSTAIVCCVAIRWSRHVTRWLWSSAPAAHAPSPSAHHYRPTPTPCRTPTHPPNLSRPSSRLSSPPASGSAALSIITPHTQNLCKSMPAPHHSVFLQAGCPSCRPTNSVKAMKANIYTLYTQCTKNRLKCENYTAGYKIFREQQLNSGRFPGVVDNLR